MLTNAKAYLPHMRLNPLKITKCPVPECEAVFPLADAFAAPAIVDGHDSIAFFCSGLCYLKVIPPEICGHA